MVVEVRTMKNPEGRRPKTYVIGVRLTWEELQNMRQAATLTFRTQNAMIKFAVAQVCSDIVKKAAK
jgi:hypothetical protein